MTSPSFARANSYHFGARGAFTIVKAQYFQRPTAPRGPPTVLQSVDPCRHPRAIISANTPPAPARRRSGGLLPPPLDDRGQGVETVGQRRRAGLQDQRRLDL